MEIFSVPSIGRILYFLIRIQRRMRADLLKIRFVKDIQEELQLSFPLKLGKFEPIRFRMLQHIRKCCKLRPQPFIANLYRFQLQQINSHLLPMNSLVFNPKPHIVLQWVNIYLPEPEIDQFQDIIDTACHHLDIIASNRLKRTNSIIESKNSEGSSPRNVPTQQGHPPEKQSRMEEIIFPFSDPRSTQKKEAQAARVDPESSFSSPKKKKKENSIKDEVRIVQCIKQVKDLKEQFQRDYLDYLNRQLSSSNSSSQYPEIAMQLNQIENLRLSREVQVCEEHLKHLKRRTLAFYDQFLEEENELIYSFVGLKIKELKQNFTKITEYLGHKDKTEGYESVANKIRILFDNLYIKAEYLKMLIRKNCEVFENNNERDYSGDQPEVVALRERQHRRLQELENEVQEIKKDIRVLYFQNFNTNKRKKKIGDHNKLEAHIRKEVAVNEGQYGKMGNRTVWLSGFIFAILLMAFVSIIVFREVNISDLEQETDYKIQFQIWRGASYVVMFSWVLAVVFFVMDYTGINYRLAMLQDDFFLQKYQSFFWSACVLTFIYLALFLIYLLQKLNYIVGYPHLQNLGYYMWLVNILYWINPFKILNYHSRMYFLMLLGKNLICLFKPMNLNIFLMAIILSSWAQPLNDISFTICTLHTYDQTICQEQGRTATFIYMLVYAFFRIGQNIRFQTQDGTGRIYSRPNAGSCAVVMGTHTVIVSYIFGNNDTHELLVYWIIAAAISTIVGIHADFKADWGFINCDEGSWFFRSTLHFKKTTYYFWLVVDAVLNVTWVLTISNTLNAFLNINVLYFFMLIQYIQLCRKGLWMVFRVEDDHSLNEEMLRAVADDSHFKTQIQQVLVKPSAGNTNLDLGDKKVVCEGEVHSGQEKGSTKNKSIFQMFAKQPQMMQSFAKQPQMMQSVGSMNKLEPEEDRKQVSPPKAPQNILFPIADAIDQAGPNIFDLLGGEVEIKIEDIQIMIRRKKDSIVKVREFIHALHDYFKLIGEIYKKLNWEEVY